MPIGDVETKKISFIFNRVGSTFEEVFGPYLGSSVAKSVSDNARKVFE